MTRLCVCLLMIFLIQEQSGAQNIAINNIPCLRKLPVNAIHRIFQDKEGYMWYGTVDGLCRDDGYHVKIFRSDINTPGLLDNNLVECITEDHEEKIWFGTDKGVYILDKKDYFLRPLDYKRLKNQFIYRIDTSSNGYIWVSIWGKLLKYCPDGTLVRAYPIRYNGQETFVGGFCEGRNKTLIITYNDGGIYHLDKQTDTFRSYPSGLKRNNPTVIIQDREHDYYWLSTWGDGLVRFNPNAPQDSMYIYQPLPINCKGEKNGIILYIKQDDKLGYLWGTSSHDLVAYKQDKKGMLKQIKLDLLPTSNRMLNDLIKDRWGNLWISAFDQPSFIVHFMEDTPKGYSLPTLRNRISYNPAIMSLADSGNGIMWFSQERTGICLYNIQNNRMSCYKDFNETKDLQLESVKEMSDTRLNGAVWVVPENTLLAYRLGRKGMTMQLLDKIDLSIINASGNIRKIMETSDGNHLWLGTTNGLYQYQFKNKKFTMICDTLGFVTSMTQSADGTTWVCTNDKGLYKITPQGVCKSYPMSPSFSSSSITTDGILWLGSEEGGIYSFDPYTEQIKDYSNICGMNGDQINQIFVDMFNHIWIDTNQKIIEFNPRNSSFRTYSTTDGTMLLWRLIPTSMCQGKDGNIYFGGIPGICSVTPSTQLEREAHKIKTLITDVKIMKHSILFGTKRKQNSPSAILLNPNDHNLEISFSSLNHRLAHKIRYAYKLEDIDKDWNYTANGENTAFYNYLPKGNYTFLVKATDENGLWSKEITKMSIQRLPAFYETWYAYLGYILGFIGILGYLLYIYLKRIERKHNEMWADSKEMIKMRHYLDSEVNLQESEYIQLDKILLEKAVKSVEAHLTEPNFDVTGLAEDMNMSRSTLTRKLKAITGRTPLNFIRNIKMKHARHLLEDKGKSVTEVATTLGYFNRKYFTACFKEEFGLTPSEYQKNMQEET